MSHHAEDFDPKMSEAMREFIKGVPEQESEIFKRFEARCVEAERKLGATGKFPEGKLTDMDEGEIAFAVFHKDGKVILDFGTQVTWMGMNPGQAVELGKLLLKHAKKARK